MLSVHKRIISERVLDREVLTPKPFNAPQMSTTDAEINSDNHVPPLKSSLLIPMITLETDQYLALRELEQISNKIIYYDKPKSI